MIKLTKKQGVIYKKRWQQVESVQAQELRTATTSLRFKQLCFLMDSFHSAQPDRVRQKEVGMIRKRWLILNKVFARDTKKRT